MVDLIDDRELARLSALYRYGLPDERLRPVWDDIVEHLARRAQAPYAWLDVVGARQVHRLAQVGPGEADEFRRGALGNAVIDHASHVLVADTHADRAYADDLAVVGGPYIRAFAGAPLRSDKEPVGLVAVADVRPRHFGSEVEAALVEACGKIHQTLDAHMRERIDPQTQALSRLAFEQQVERMGALVGHGLDGLSIAVLDVEPLHERLNFLDPALGALLFEYIAGLGREQVRRRDALGRLGPFRFAILLAKTSEAGALVMARRMTRRLVAEWTALMPTLDATSLVRGGIATWRGRMEAPESFVARAEAGVRGGGWMAAPAAPAKVA